VNNSKKIKAKKPKEDKLLEKKNTFSMSKPWLITSVILIVAIIGGLLVDQLYKPTLMTVDGKKYHMNDLAYYFYTVETTYSYYNQMFGGNYWDMSIDEKTGTTMRDQARTEVKNTSLENEILYKEAVKNGYSLTDEEKKTVNANVDSMLKGQMSKDVIDKNDFTKSYLRKVLGKLALISRFRQDKIDALDIDDQAIKDGIKFEDYKQYDIQYLHISTSKTDGSGNSTAMTDAEKKDAYNKLSTYLDKAKTTEDWTNLVPTDVTDITYNKDDNFIQSDSKFTKEFKDAVMPMENKAVSGIIEDSNGYYIVRMVNNNSSESYDAAVKDAITQKENEGFTKVYEDIKATHKFKFNDKEFNKLKMGTVTLLS
jgi:foldase protein PrsA